MPGVVDPGTLGEANLADDLGPHMQGGAGITPCLKGKCWARPRRANQSIASTSPPFLFTLLYTLERRPSTWARTNQC